MGGHKIFSPAIALPIGCVSWCMAPLLNTVNFVCFGDKKTALAQTCRLCKGRNNFLWCHLACRVLRGRSAESQHSPAL